VAVPVGAVAAAVVLVGSAVGGGPVSVASAVAPAVVPGVVPPEGVATGQDGFTPILYEPSPFSGGGPEVWVIARQGHTSMQAPRVSCVVLNTGEKCDDAHGEPTTWPKPLNTNPGPLGSGNTSDLATTQVPQFVGPSGSGQPVLYPAVTRRALPGFPSGSVGVGCLNMEDHLNCGYTPLAALTDTAGQSNVNGLTGFVQVGDHVYGTATNGQELCARLAEDGTTASACPGQPYSSDTPPNNDVAGLGPTDFHGTKAVVGGRIYTASNANGGTAPARTTSPHPPTLTCFDPATNAPCAGWTPKTITDPGAYQALAVIGRHDTRGTATGVCAITGNKTTAAPIVTCYDRGGNTLPPPPGLSDLFPAGGRHSVVFQPLTTTGNGDLRTYLPFYTEDRTHLGSTLCYSWNDQAPCPSFPNPLAHPDVNAGDTRDYGYAYTPLTGCMYGNGAPGHVFSFDPNTGTPGC
jgi:hypothetical protein